MMIFIQQKEMIAVDRLLWFKITKQFWTCSFRVLTVTSRRHMVEGYQTSGVIGSFIDFIAFRHIINSFLLLGEESDRLVP